MQRQEAAGRLVDVHDAVCADSVLAVSQHSLMNSRCVSVELFHAVGGLLAAQVHAVYKLSDPLSAGTGVVSLCVEPFVHQAPDRHRAEAQDVGDPHNVLAQPCHVCG